MMPPELLYRTYGAIAQASELLARQISFTPRAMLASLLTLSCVGPLNVNVTAATSARAAASEKKHNSDPALKGLPISELSADEAILHALNRLAYGPRPGDVERIKQMGLAKWIDQQLNPNSLDDRAVEARINIYHSLGMSSAQLIAQYPNLAQAAKQAGVSKEEFVKEEKAQRQADAAVNAMAREMPGNDAQGTTARGSAGNGEVATMSDAPSPMKQNPATKGGDRKSTR